MNSKNILKLTRRLFSKKYDGIEGDVNWRNGKIIDGRPHLRRGKTNLPKKIDNRINYFASDYTPLIRELDNPVYLTYNTRSQGVNKKLDIVLTDEKK